MAAVNVTIIGTLTTADGASQPATLQGMASLTGLGVGGGPIMPPDKPPGSPGVPTFPIWGPPGSSFPDKPGYPPVVGGGPIIPPDQLPPDVTPPTPPQPGDPTKPLPLPPGVPGMVVNPIVPPPFIVVNYPGIGPVIVAPPVQAAPTG